MPGRFIQSTATLTALNQAVSLELRGFSEDFTAGVAGTFSASVQIEVTNDGTNWFPFGAALTAPSIGNVDCSCRAARLRVSSYVSGTIIATLSAGEDT